jgi:hypothetical protein
LVRLSTSVETNAAAITTGTVTITNVANGNLVILNASGAVGATSATFNGSAMSLVATTGVGDYQIRVFAIIASSPPTTTSIVVTFPFASSYSSIRAAEFSNVSSATPLTSAVAASGTLQAASTNRFAPSITTGANSLIVVAGYEYDSDGYTITPTSGWATTYSAAPSWGFMAHRYAAAGTYLGLATSAFGTTTNGGYQTTVIAFPK